MKYNDYCYDFFMKTYIDMSGREWFAISMSNTNDEIKLDFPWESRYENPRKLKYLREELFEKIKN